MKEKIGGGEGAENRTYKEAFQAMVCLMRVRKWVAAGEAHRTQKEKCFIVLR